MRDAFGVERSVISKGLPSALRSGKAVGDYAVARTEANQFGRSASKLMRIRSTATGASKAKDMGRSARRGSRYRARLAAVERGFDKNEANQAFYRAARIKRQGLLANGQAPQGKKRVLP